MGARQRPRREPRKPKQQKPVTKHHRDAKDCTHPVNARIGDQCAQCGERVKGR